jgi:lipid A 3-O-deacylase
MRAHKQNRTLGERGLFSLLKAVCTYLPRMFSTGVVMDRSIKRIFAALPLAIFALAAQPAMAQEVYVGASDHATDTPFSLNTRENGVDLQAGIRSKRIEALDFIGKPSAYLHAQVSLDGDTSLAAAGLSWKIGDKIYVRPGIGLAIHTDKIRQFVGTRRVDLGSRILFEPEIALGAKLTDKMAAEISWVHISHAQLLSGQNPGMDFIGARLVFSLK